ncbi:hypothetical protein EP7_005411 [Isosphaeraceae bacterium EP7]
MPTELRPSGRTAISVRCLNPRSKISVGSGTVYVDGRRVGLTIAGKDRAFRVRPGIHTVEVRYGMSRSNEVDLKLAPGDQAALAFKLGGGSRPMFGSVSALSCYMALLPILVGLAYAAREPWGNLVPAVLNATTFTQAMMPWLYYVAPGLSSWTVLALLLNLVWLAGLPLVLLNRGPGTGELLRQVLGGGEIILKQEDRLASLSPIDLMVTDPGPTPEDHLSLQAARNARATLRSVQRPASRDEPAE